MSFVASPALKRRVLNAGSWSLAGYAFSYAFRLSSNLIMTRLLVPEMFGLMAIATMVLVGLSMLSDLGLKPSVVQNQRGNEASFLNTAWVLQIGRGVAMAVAMCIVALGISFADHLGVVPAGTAYADPSLPYVILALSLTIAISAFESTKMLQASRNLFLARVTALEIISQVFGFTAMLAWAIQDRSIWALVAGSVVSALTKTGLSHVALPGVSNRLMWDQSAYDAMVRLGKWIFLSSILYFIATNGDRILLGAMIDPASLGAYSVAFLIFGAVDQLLTRMVVDVSFPALSEVIRDRPSGLKRTYYRFHLAIATAAYFCGGGLIASGESIISVLYDARYQQAGPVLEILGLALFAYPLRVATQAFLALGLARVYFQLHFIRIAALLLGVPIGFNLFGINGAVCGVVFSYFSSLPITAIQAARVGIFDLRREIVPFPAVALGWLCGEVFNLGIAYLLH